MQLNTRLCYCTLHVQSVKRNSAFLQNNILFFTYPVLSCIHQSSGCQPFSKLHKMHQPYWQFKMQQSNTQWSLYSLRVHSLSVWGQQSPHSLILSGGGALGEACADWMDFYLLKLWFVQIHGEKWHCNFNSIEYSSNPIMGLELCIWAKIKTLIITVLLFYFKYSVYIYRFLFH